MSAILNCLKQTRTRTVILKYDWLINYALFCALSEGYFIGVRHLIQVFIE